MASETGHHVEPEVESPHRLWVDAGAAGLAAGVLMGLVMQFAMDIVPLVGGLYGVESAPAGWAMHLVHAHIFGLTFAAVTSAPELRSHARRPATAVVLGLAWAAVLWVVAAGVVMPVWMGLAALHPPPVPNLDPVDGLAHAVYGVTLGGVFGSLRAG